MTDEALSEYEVLRRRRIEENRRVLASLALPNMPCSSSRSQAPKITVKLEPTRRSSRTRCETFKQHEIVANQQKVQNKTQQMQQIAIIALAKQQLKQKRKQQQEIKALEMAKKKQKIEARKFERSEKSKQREMELQVAEKKQQQVIETRKRQMERQKQDALPPEIVAKRNADIQKFIQEELDKQAYLAREQKQWELLEHQIFGQEQMLKQDEVHKEIATTGLVEENKTVEITDEFAEAALMEMVMGESEYELVL